MEEKRPDLNRVNVLPSTAYKDNTYSKDDHNCLCMMYTDHIKLYDHYFHSVLTPVVSSRSQTDMS